MYVVGEVMTYLDVDVITGLNNNHHHIFLGGPAAAYGMRYTFSGLNSGDHDVWITWPTGWGDRSSVTSVEVFDDATSEIDTTIDQSVDPSGVSDLGKDWTSVGRINISSGTLKVQITGKNAAANKRIICDGVRIQQVSNSDLHYGDDAAWPSTGSASQSRRLGVSPIGVSGVRIH